MNCYGGDSSAGVDRRRSRRVAIEPLEARTLMSAAPAPPSMLTVVIHGPTAIQLSWTEQDTSAEGYFVLRSEAGEAFSPIAQITSSGTMSYTDTTVSSDTAYQYKVESYNAGVTSLTSNTASVTTPLSQPASFAAVAETGGVELNWSASSSVASYYVLRSSDGNNFSQIAIVTEAGASGYTDDSVTAGQTYSYKIEACNGRVSSPFTATQTATVPIGGGDGQDDVTITTRYNDELVITAPGSADDVDLTQSGDNLTIDANGFSTTDPIPAAGIFVYTRGGNDAIDIGSTVSAFTTIDTIDGAATTIQSAGANVSAWIDSTDSYTGTGDVHRVASFVGGVSKALGASLPDPSDSGATTTVNLSLWGTGPVMGDVNQGEVGDCYFLSTLAAFANTDPSLLRESAVDLGDGTYAVQFYNNGVAEYVRVNDTFATGPFGGFEYAHPGSDDTIWAMVMEKAYAYFRTGANTYASINAGWMGDVYTALNVQNAAIFPEDDSQTAFYDIVTADLADSEPVTLATADAPVLVNDHAYTLVSAYESDGVTYYVVRNPWGVSGDSLENSQGYATLTFAQVQANFVEGCMAI
ncbi:MAG TPA: C2 family cysteine protease [Tepidisphaeraceae bacterium]|nr:C2 family cysteine protease [Tepidisphaeraceae bacterium]